MGHAPSMNLQVQQNMNDQTATPIQTEEQSHLRLPPQEAKVQLRSWMIPFWTICHPEGCLWKNNNYIPLNFADTKNLEFQTQFQN